MKVGVGVDLGSVVVGGAGIPSGPTSILLKINGSFVTINGLNISVS